MQLSFNASIRLEIFNHRNFVRFGLSEIASGHASLMTPGLADELNWKKTT